MPNKKLEKLDACQNNPNGLLRFMAEQQVKTNTRLAYIMGIIAGGAAICIPLLFLILDKVTGG